MKLSQLPAGSKVRDHRCPLVFLVADQTGNAYPGTVLISDHLAAAGCFDSPEPSHTEDDLRQFGWNRYPVSNVHRWLNSELSDWYTPAHPFDAPPDQDALLTPYASAPGFLAAFSPEFRAALQPVEIIYRIQDDYYQRRHETVSCRVFLPSRTELCLEKDPTCREGVPLELFALSINHDLPKNIQGLTPPGLEYVVPIYQNAYPTAELTARHHLSPREFDPRIPYPYWLRTVNLAVRSEVSFAGPGKEQFFKAGKGSCGIRPMVVLSPETELEDRPDRFGAYLIKEV